MRRQSVTRKRFTSTNWSTPLRRIAFERSWPLRTTEPDMPMSTDTGRDERWDHPSTPAKAWKSTRYLAGYRLAFGNRLTATRERAGYAVEEAARLVGITPATLRSYD